MKWIPCEERLPNDNREVLISLEWGIDIGTYERGEWRSEWINHYDDDNVLAWMPLPQPYTADRKTESDSEKPNNCEELNAYRECVKSRSFWDSKHCDGCYFDERCPFDEPMDEPQTEDFQDWKDRMWAEAVIEPKTERSE